MLYDIIIPRKRINKKRIILVIIAIISLVGLSIITAISLVNKNNWKQYAIQVENKYNAIQEYKKVEKLKEQERDKIIKMENAEYISKIKNIYNSNEKRVFLTFDDGPSQSVTPLILDLLKKENIKATFFMLGNRVEVNPDIVKRIYNEGHTLGNHGYSHKYKEIYLSSQTILDEYNKTEQCIKDALENQDFSTRLFRFPGGSSGGYYDSIKQEGRKLLEENGIGYVDWNALSNDAAGANTKEALLENLKNTIGEKQSVVILMHDAGDKILTYEILPDLIVFLREKGYNFRAISDIL